MSCGDDVVSARDTYLTPGRPSAATASGRPGSSSSTSCFVQNNELSAVSFPLFEVIRSTAWPTPLVKSMEPLSPYVVSGLNGTATVKTAPPASKFLVSTDAKTSACANVNGFPTATELEGDASVGVLDEQPTSRAATAKPEMMRRNRDTCTLLFYARTGRGGRIGHDPTTVYR